MTRWLAYIPLAALLVVMAAGGLLLTRGGERQTISEGVIGRPAPAYSLPRLDGQGAVDNAERSGRAYVVNVFASWCTPCRAEHAQLAALHGEAVDIVGVAYKDRPAAAARFLAELGNPYSSVGMDPEGDFGLQLGIAGVPETFVIGPDNTIRAVHRGPLTPEIIETTILPALRG
jgi:cytochrome c biogenesis protein CcmG/thiol:disulfide interchange protein DsbE